MNYAMSRRKRGVIYVVILLLAGILIWLDHSPVRGKWQKQPESAEQAKFSDIEKYHAKSFTVVRVVDGDTIDIDVADGNYPHTRIRLWGIDTPETKSPEYGVMYFGPEAAEFTKELTLGKLVTVYLDKDNRSRVNTADYWLMCSCLTAEY